MRLCNDTVTVYNAYFDATLDDGVYYPTVLRGVSWHGALPSATSDSSGLMSADAVTVRIPVSVDTDAEYADPKMYASSGPSGLWTLQPGDIVVNGDHSADTSSHPCDILSAHSEAFTIRSVTDNRRAPNAPHWRVVGS